MTRILFILIIALSSLYATAQVSYDRKLLTSDTVVDFSITKYRGIRTVDGTVYYLERDHQTLSAYANEKILWQMNVVKACEPKIPNAEIRYLYLTDTHLRLVFGKNGHAEVRIDNGKVDCRP